LRGVRARGTLERALRDRAPELGREAGHRAGMARGAGRRDAEQNRVAVAVVADLVDCERVARRLALAPQLLARPAPEPGLARLAREPLRLVVHPREHQHAPGARVLHDRRLHRSATPRSRSSVRSVPSRAGSSCRIEASSAACATPSASATWLASPAPPEAITGRSTASATAPVSSRS